MAAKKVQKNESSVFEIVVVLAIVFIVAFTGQVLISYKGYAVRTGVAGSSGDQITGAVIAGEEEASSDYADVGIKDVEVNPPSPLVGEAFEIRIIIKNEGLVDINEPFYVNAEIIPSGDAQPIFMNSAVVKNLNPGDESVVIFNIAMVSKEGPVKIIATADSTAKLDDKNTANNQRSKTIIISAQ